MLRARGLRPGLGFGERNTWTPSHFGLLPSVSWSFRLGRGRFRPVFKAIRRPRAPVCCCHTTMPGGFSACQCVSPAHISGVGRDLIPWFCGRCPWVRGVAAGGKLLNFSEPQLPSSQMGKEVPRAEAVGNVCVCQASSVTLPPSFPFNVEMLWGQHYSITFSP